MATEMATGEGQFCHREGMRKESGVGVSASLAQGWAYCGPRESEGPGGTWNTRPTTAGNPAAQQAGYKRDVLCKPADGATGTRQDDGAREKVRATPGRPLVPAEVHQAPGKNLKFSRGDASIAILLGKTILTHTSLERPRQKKSGENKTTRGRVGKEPNTQPSRRCLLTQASSPSLSSTLCRGRRGQADGSPCKANEGQGGRQAIALG
jgi:hypothetical protein